MKKIILASLAALTMSLGATAFAFGPGGPGGPGGMPPHALLSQLPEDKEMLFHQTMRQVMEDSEALMEEVRAAHEQANVLLTAETFDEEAFLAATQVAEELHSEMHGIRIKAMAALANQFTVEEREILAQLLGPKGPGPKSAEQE